MRVLAWRSAGRTNEVFGVERANGGQVECETVRQVESGVF